MDGLTIRQATVADAATLAALNLSIQRMHVDARPDVFKAPDVDELTIFMRGRLSDPNCVAYIAQVDGTSVGYTINAIVQRPVNPFTHPLAHVLVDNISVEPAYRSQGIGEALMDRVYALARELGIQRVTLAVWAFNARAVAFYERLGFAPYQVYMEKVLD